MTEDWEQVADRYAAEAVADGQPTAWFERLYRAAVDDVVAMPWNRDTAHPLAAAWLDRHPDLEGRGMVVGCGLGADAEMLAQRGFQTAAFDVSPTAVATARSRHPHSPVDYRVADLFDLPTQWRGAFDFVLEINTVQALPRDVRDRAIAAVSSLVAPGGTLLVIAFRGRLDAPGPPWPLTEDDIARFADRLERIEVTTDTTPTRPDFARWVGAFRGRSAGSLA